ncbi:radical SAM family heme chaperone HemW [Histidinibacterium lentulum]|uniref:Heme chaperone HemW n=1 Tax=Histidinibacterium lentulum TaxID=2480588 RepID=A0A3N2R6N9_9RHOB|nr:radical SAM family heme chaperone HemW [Histidinibacterium lentulum]ROU03155.1 coproporphyrinogen III oxidase [Histidinibacterium lentulum]
MAEDWQAGGFGLYVHWPFCQAKCPYCDFNSHVVAGVDQERWARALVAEIRRYGEQTGPRVLGSVFFGGGTPSLMGPETVAAVLEAVRETWPRANDLEVTLEANPTSVEAGRFRGYRDAGVTRVSLGVQALDDESLRRLGRLHSADEARAAFGIARDVFERVSFDLIYARQDQGVEDWRRELGAALALAVDHLSLYQLTIEEGTAFGARHAAGGLKGLPDEDRAADLWEVTQEMTAAAGMASYEVSNHARPDAVCYHNMVYWRSGDYAAVGPGAHGRLTLDGQRWATVAHRAPGKWMDGVERTGTGEEERTPLSHEDRLTEMLLMGLRLREGVAVERLDRLGWDPAPARELAEAGWLRFEGGRLAATAQAWPVLNAVLRELVPG